MLLQRRRLPHIYPEGRALFVTWHLYGSLPAPLPPPPSKLTSGQAFVWLERRLDKSLSGPTYLRQPAIAQIVVGSIHTGAFLGHYALGAYVVMANHVHLLIRPKIAPDRLMKSLRGSTARKANRALGRTGGPFWQKESYDHWVRSQQEFERIRAYIENNPVHAGFVRAPEEFLWSSASVEKSLYAARISGAPPGTMDESNSPRYPGAPSSPYPDPRRGEPPRPPRRRSFHPSSDRPI